MRLVAFSTLFALAILAAPLTSLGAAVYDAKSQKITELNRTPPLQNPKLDRSSDILGRRMLDNKSKVVGSIQDVILTKSGNIAFLDVKFDRMQLNKPVFVNYNNFKIETVSNGYAMPFEASEIENVYPQLLADIETASGETDTNFSLRKLQGMEVRTDTGKKIGNVGDVLFNNDGQRAEAIYVALSQGTLRGKSIAIPFNQADITSANISHQVIISDATADAMTNLAKGK